ncbi:MAG: Gfo/Idh/MocA family oxidoreductase [Candidatus Aenigmarchaeota archaeon]|nr:Gfo/Idh/MocA family oxidoreductase [Candidatus Aenigmarchaeota archaeon]
MVIRIGLIGCGVVTQKAHIPAIIKDQRFRITALCRRKVDKLEPIKSQFPHAKIYSDANKLMESGEVDCVLVATDVDSHLSIAQVALNNNLFVLLEKPVSSSSKSIKEFIETNGDRSNRLMVAFNKRFYPGIIKFDELRKSGELGNLVGCTMSFFTQHGRKEGEAGVLQNLIHYCDLLCWLLGKPKEVNAKFSSILNDNKRGKTISTSILTENGCTVNLFYTSSANWRLPVHERIEAIDDKNNHAYIENADKLILTKFNQSETQIMLFSESNSVFWKPDPFGYDAQISKFGDLVEGKLLESSPNLKDALNAQMLFEKIFEFNR